MAEATVEQRGIPVFIVVRTTKMIGGVAALAREGEEGRRARWSKAKWPCWPMREEKRRARARAWASWWPTWKRRGGELAVVVGQKKGRGELSPCPIFYLGIVFLFPRNKLGFI
jgi:hypothetical protein